MAQYFDDLLQTRTKTNGLWPVPSENYDISARSLRTIRAATWESVVRICRASKSLEIRLVTSISLFRMLGAERFIARTIANITYRKIASVGRLTGPGRMAQARYDATFNNCSLLLYIGCIRRAGFWVTLSNKTSTAMWSFSWWVTSSYCF